MMLIKTKLQPPSLRSRLLYRRNLIDKLCTAGESPVVLISGPAGSGKTSLACQWIEREKQRVAWYSLDEEDDAPDLFFRYLLTTLIQADQQLSHGLSPMLTNRRELRSGNVIPEIIEALSGLQHDIRLVLDDFHHITKSEIHAAMVRLMQYMPGRLHLVILSRHCLTGPIDAAAVKKECMALDVEDLKFTEAESIEFFKKITPNRLDADQIRDLNRHLEGWAIGLRLTGLSIESKQPPAVLSDILNQAHDQIAGYLIHDILQMQPQKIRNFILATAPLDRFNPELCIEVTGMPDAARILERLEKMNLFLTPLGSDRQWFRYHHMFSEVIRRQVIKHAPDRSCATLHKAALWLAQNDHLEDALRYAFRSNDIGFAADLMEDHILRYAEQFDLTTGLRWILKLPESMLNQRALLRLQQCTFLFLMMEPADVKEIMAFIERNGNPAFSRYSGAKLALCHDYAAYFNCMLRILYKGNTEVMAEFQALQNKCLPKNPLMAAAVDFMMTFILISNGDLAVAQTFLDRISKVPVNDAGQLIRKKIFVAKANALIARHNGRLRQSEAIIMQVLQRINEQGYGHPSMAFLLHRHLGHIFYLQNRLKEAQACAANVIEHCEHSGIMDEIMAGNELQLQLHLAADNHDQAKQSIQQLRSLAAKLQMPQIATFADVWTARLAIGQGNLAAAERWSRQRRLQLDEPFSILFAVECLTQARLDYGMRQYQKALYLLEKVRNRCKKRKLADLLLQIDILRIAILNTMQRHEEAASLLKETLTVAQCEGYLRPFVNDAGLIAPVLRHIADKLSRALPADYIAMLFSACGVSLDRPDALSRFNHEGHEQLSQREIEILEWMAQGFQNKEIAKKAFISINTVKTHTRRILVKLNVKTRTQAVLKGKNLNIIHMGLGVVLFGENLLKITL